MIIRTILQRIIARFMRAFFYLLYQPMAWSYDLVAAAVSWGRWRGWVLTVLPYLKGPCILEIGHGPGHLQAALHGKGFVVFGIDISAQMGRLASQRINKQRHTPLILRGYAQHQPFTNMIFDQIVATFPTAYIYDQSTLAEAYRILKPGGRLVVLPAAWITGKRLADRGAAALFRITGQSPDQDHPWSEPFLKAGFQTDVNLITGTSWSLIIISAQKPDEPSTT
jgi:ubiquinone/menaquinone biosynthesis C-methylase UbiE